MPSLPNNDHMPEAARSIAAAQAIEHLKSLHDGDRGFAEVVSVGNETIPGLRALLLQREPSGLFQARCRAVDALAALHAYDVLAEFLSLERRIDDPVERVGEDAVLNAAALAIANVHEEWVFQLLFRLADERLLRGTLAGLSAFKRLETIPLLIRALAEDDLHLTAASQLRDFGQAAAPFLVRAAVGWRDDGRPQSETRLRMRRRALLLLSDMNIASEWPALRSLIEDDDDWIAILAAKLCLRFGSKDDLTRMARHLRKLNTGTDWLKRREIESILGSLHTRSRDRENS
jgi:hypothetical protein